MTERPPEYTIRPGCGVEIGPDGDEWTGDHGDPEARSRELARIEALLADHGAPGESVEEKVRNLMAVEVLAQLMRQDRDKWRAAVMPLRRRLRSKEAR